MTLDKFNVPFIDFVAEHFDITQHQFVFLQAPQYKYGMTKETDVIWIDKKYKVVELLKYMYEADKIIIHGLWSTRLIQILFLQPWLLKKCYWIMWGGDFYFPEKQSWIKKQVIKKMGYLLTGTTGDYELAKKWYGAKGKHIKCFNYPSNLYKDYHIRPKVHSTINIQLGNSADPTNHHIEVLQSLEKFKDKNIQIFVPLSYGNLEYAKEVILKGKEIFGDKFIAFTDFMLFEKYMEFLSEIDIAIFNHRRQQAFGNIISLVGMGKKVYLNKISTLNDVFEELNIKIFNTSDINLEKIDKNVQLNNIEKIQIYYSQNKLREQLEKIFEMRVKNEKY